MWTLLNFQPLTTRTKKTIDALHQWILLYHGMTGAPLSYNCREDVIHPILPNLSASYDSIEDYMVAYAPIKSAICIRVTTFVQENKRAWNLIMSVLQDNVSWVYNKHLCHTRYGRRNFLALHSLYIGPNNVDNMASKAENKLETLSYEGEKRS